MNNQAILFHLREAKGELDRTISEMGNRKVYDNDEFRVAMSHLYHHLNTAWNGRNASPEQHRTGDEKDFCAWRKFPENQDLLLE
jgi:hypothetical protein